jgi:hypothetical protein
MKKRKKTQKKQMIGAAEGSMYHTQCTTLPQQCALHPHSRHKRQG